MAVQNVASLFVTTAETHHTPPHLAHMHWLVFTSVQQTSVNVTESHFFGMEEFSDTLLLHTHPMPESILSDCLLLCCHLPHSNKMEWDSGGILWDTISTAIPPTSASSVMGQHYKIGRITFGAALVLNTFFFSLNVLVTNPKAVFLFVCLFVATFRLSCACLRTFNKLSTFMLGVV